MTAALVLSWLVSTLPPAPVAHLPSAVPPSLHRALSLLADVRSDVRVGEWVTYRLDGGPGREAFLRLAIVGEEPDAAGRPAYWLELEVGMQASMRAPLAQLGVRVTRSIGFRAQGISRMVVALAHAPPAELSPSELARLFAPTAGADAFPAARADGQTSIRQGGAKRRVMTDAGTLEATPVELSYRGQVVQRVWLSPTVPILKLARIDGPRVLVGGLPTSRPALSVFAFGFDATSQMRLSEPKGAKLEVESKGTP